MHKRIIVIPMEEVDNPWKKSTGFLVELLASENITEEDCARFCHVFSREFYHQVADVLMNRLRDSLKTEILAEMSIMLNAVKPPSAADMLSGLMDMPESISNHESILSESTSNHESTPAASFDIRAPGNFRSASGDLQTLSDPNDADDEMPRKKSPEELLAENPIFKMVSASNIERREIINERRGFYDYSHEDGPDESEGEVADDVWEAAMKSKYACE